MNAKKLVGGEGKRRDQVSGEVLGVWKTDIIDNRDENFEYEFVHESKVSDKLRPGYVTLKDWETNEVKTERIPPWEVVQQDLGPEKAAGFRPDEGKPQDTVLRHGPHVCMRLPKHYWDLLQKAQGQVADRYDALSRKGTKRDFNSGGQESNAVGDKPYVRTTEQPLKRI